MDFRGNLTKLLAILLALLLYAGAAFARRSSKTKNGKAVSAKSLGKSAKTRRASKRRSSKRRARRRRSRRRRGQQAIDAARTREIQAALIRERYLEGEPSGKWDSRSQQAMARYQRDHGWQDKVTPDARALIKLGLGPNHENLLNPETAATTFPAPGGQSAAELPTNRQ